MTDKEDSRTIYCNQLGMLIEFSYCSTMNGGLPCRNIVGCWKQRTDIVAFLKKNFTGEELRKVFSGLPKSRIERIIELIKS
ncbi:MAG: hypothetical protein IBX72_10245 [Nitrospirae bacterium]|jgi:hypothetical protein|nr:hypothetical protein [Nitrospirota bacterium]